MKIKICGITTRWQTIKWFMLDNLRYAGDNGFDPYIICEPTDVFDNEDMGNIKYIPIPMNRGNVSPIEVLKVTFALYKQFKKEKFDIIQYASSNAGLYACIAGWFARVPVRIYCQWGISYTDYKGIKLFFYKMMERVTCMFSTHVQPDSYANLRFAVEEGLYSIKKGSVLNYGSACGVNMQRFDIAHKEEWRKKVRLKYCIPETDKVICFVGRLVPEKGINELFEAFLGLKEQNTTLLVVGPYYEVDRLNQELYLKAQAHPKIIFTGPVNNTEEFYAAMDFLVLPSYREGFGSVTLEAAAMGVPILVSNIKGPTDFVVDNYNGIIFDVQSVSSLLNAMKKAMSLSSYEYNILSMNAYYKVKKEFDSVEFKKVFIANRQSIISKKRKGNV